MTLRFMSATPNGIARRAGVLGLTCTAALLAIQPVLLPLAGRADDGNNGGYATSVNAAQGKIAAGTQIKVRLLDPISSGTARVGDRFRVAVASDDSSGLPSGTVFFGQVSKVTPGTPSSAGSVTLQLALPRGSYAFDQFDSGNSYNDNTAYNNAASGYNGPSGNGSNSDDNNSGNYSPTPNGPAAGDDANGQYHNGEPSDGNVPVAIDPPVNGEGASNGPYNHNPVPYAPTLSNDASGTFSGHSPRSASHVAGIAAAAGAILGFSRKRKLGDAIEGGALGGVGGVAYDQTQKRSASDVSFKRGDEITVRLNRPMVVRTIVVPAG